MKSQVDAVTSAVEAAASAAATGAEPGATPTGAIPTTATPTAATPSCAKAIACCKATMAKTGGANAAAAEQACNGVALLPEDICKKQYDAYKRAATVVSAICP